ncbi:unnamed protein product [Rangifer tarandus platyrhynchus]|uniref:Uncharacterized protein n=1 Tax=Rangifer tarandus platyrhynchus TaxID=3082113 RepID=A0ABN9A301_RANTA|nr:unnamed protein product [Rangifer tarandus platyrhynchus]
MRLQPTHVSTQASPHVPSSTPAAHVSPCPWSTLAFGPSLAPLPWFFQDFALVAMSRFLSFWGWEQDGGEIRKGSVNVGKGSLLQLSTPLPALGLVLGMLCWAYGLVRDSLHSRLYVLSFVLLNP